VQRRLREHREQRLDDALGAAHLGQVIVDDRHAWRGKTGPRRAAASRVVHERWNVVDIGGVLANVLSRARGA
jgi:hypothetical protein